MVRVTFSKNNDGDIVVFKVEGHAGYAPHGQDIVCAAVSAVTTSTINGIKALTDGEIEVSIDGGLIDACVLKSTSGSNVLLNSMLLSLEGIQEGYPENLAVIEIK